MNPLFCLAALLSAQVVPVAAAQIHVRVDDSRDRLAISPYIYGDNQPDWSGAAKGLPLTRVGGNRWTAYNWETNASNAGSDYLFQNDGFLGGDDIPGEAVRKPVSAAFAANASIIVTVPIAGYVSADKNGGGDVNKTPDFLNTRFYRSYPRKGRPFVYPPDLNDRAVYQDEFVAWLEKTFPDAHKDPARTLFYCLDNEPDLWDSTHARLRTTKLTYKELLQRSIDFASGIKGAAPKALIFGPVSYGWEGFERLQGAPDAGNRNFLEFYLAGMRDAERAQGTRLLDVLDVHWYPEARGGGKRVTENSNDPAVVRARLQAPRSLWDPTYREDSWIVNDALHAPIQLLPRLKKIADQYPGTRLAITEYNYGGGNHISGAISQADVLGIFGREGLFAAALWHLSTDESFAYGGFDMYRNFDGKGGHFGDVSVHADTSDVERSSVYASVDSANKDRMVIVAINKSDAPLEADLAITSKLKFGRMNVYQLTSGGPTPHALQEEKVPADRRVRYVMPAMSVSTLELRP